MVPFCTFVIKPHDVPAFLPLLPVDFETVGGESLLIGATTPSGKACGVLWLIREGLRLRLMHIETAPAYQRQGVATRLLDDLNLCMRRTGNFTPITADFVRTSRTRALYFLLAGRSEITLTIRSPIYRLTPQCRAASSAYHLLQKHQNALPSFFDSPAIEQRTFLKTMAPADHAFLKSLAPETFCKPLCMSCGSPMRAAIFFTCTGDKVLELSFLFVSPGPNATADLQRLLSASCEAIEQNYPDYTITVMADEVRLKRLVRKLFPSGIQYLNRFRADWTIYSEVDGGDSE